MSAAGDDAGAVPLAPLVRLDSDMHHLREQTDRDRRSQGSRNRDVAGQLDELRTGQGQIRLDVARVSDVVKRLEFQTSVNGETQSKILDYIAEQRGSLRVLRWLVMAVGLPAAVFFAKLLLTGHVPT